jgi:hypothetical protein
MGFRTRRITMGFRSKVFRSKVYRSGVALALSAKAEKAFQEMLSALPEDDRAMLGGCDIHKDGGGMLRLWHCYKWHEEFAEVKAVMSFIEDMDEAEYRFICIGESDDDVEQIGSFSDSFALYWDFDAPQQEPEQEPVPLPQQSPSLPPRLMLQVHNYLDLSLSHIPYDDFEKLDREIRYEGDIIVYRKDRGYFIHVPQDDVAEYLNLLHERGFSDAFRHIVQTASGLGCGWIVADADVKICPDLPTFG